MVIVFTTDHVTMNQLVTNTISCTTVTICILPGAMVQTSDGFKLIENVVSGDIVVSKEIELSTTTLNEYEMEEQAWPEAGKHFPDLINDLTLDFYVKNDPDHEEKRFKQHVVICQQKLLEKQGQKEVTKKDINWDKKSSTSPLLDR